MSTGEAPLVRKLTADADAVAKGSDGSISVGPAPFAGKVVSVTYIPPSTLTGANTNSRTLKLVNKGQSGSGTNVVAEKAFTTGVNAAAFDETALTLSGTASKLEVAQGDVLALVSEHVGEGLADPGGEFQVKIERG
jgi:hypothetical protein